MRRTTYLVAFAAVTVLALALRLWHVELTTFSSDEAVLLHLTEDMLRQGNVPLSGPLSSVGLSTPAHFLYLIAPVVAITRDPASTAGALALLGTAAVPITMVLANRVAGPTAALLSGILFATNPTAVEYSRRIWQPGPLLFLGALLLFALDRGVIARKDAWAAATLPIATAATLFHTSVAPLLPLLLAPAALLVRFKRLSQLAIAVVLSAALVAPFIAYEFQSSWKDYANFRYYSSLQSFTDLEALRWVVAITTGWRLPSDGVVPPPQRALAEPITEAASALALALLVAGIVVAITHLRKQSKCAQITRMRAAGLLLWLVLPVAFSIRHWQPLFLHYYFAQFPAVFLLMALPSTRRVAIAAILAVAIVNATALVRATAYEAAAAGTDPCFAPSIASSRAAAYEVAQFGHTHAATSAIVELDAGDARAMAYLLRADFPDVYLPHPVTTSQTPDLFGNVGLHYILPAQSLQAEPTTIRPLLTSAITPEVRYDNGVTLHELRFSTLSTQRQFLHVALAWSVDASVTSTRPIVWQVTLQSPDSRPLQADSGDSATPAILRGQSVVSWFTIDTRRDLAPNDRPPGAYQLAVALIDAFGDPPAALPFKDPTGASARSVQLPVELAPFERCPYPTVVP